MYSFRFFSKIFGIEIDNPALFRAQYRAMARQTLFLYSIVLSAVVFIAHVNYETAPFLLISAFPALLVIGDIVFFIWFMGVPKDAPQRVYDRAVLIRLHAMVWSSVVLGPLYALWVVELFEYGTPLSQGLTLFFMGMSMLGATLCLMHLRSSAVFLLVSTFGVLMFYFLMTQTHGFHGSAVILGLVGGVFVFVLNGYSRDFARMVAQKSALEEKMRETEKLSKVNSELANRDSLTGLANRRRFLSELNTQVRNVEQKTAEGVAVGILDLDGFKLINDVYGHPVGDRLLEEVGQRLKGLLCSRVFIARLGGDEFGVVVRGRLEDRELEELGEMICECMRVPFDMDGLAAHLGGSIGFAKWQNPEDTAYCLFEKADYALYHAKDNSRGSVTIFDEGHAAAIREVSGVDRRMQDADFEKEMSLVFQPIVATGRARTIGFEVLARWHSPVLGVISPDVFIRSAERAGTINRLTVSLLEKALHEARKWPEDLFMSFNLSMQDITSAPAILRLVSIVSNSGFDPKRITFEVTETAVMNDYERAMESLGLLKKLGCKIALDDFGTGYSSLAYVRALPLDKLKLDRSFITEIEQDEGAGAIVHTMIEMCDSLDVECIVEGVETRGQLAVLNAMGCEIIQGYYFSKPLSGPDALAYVRAERELDRAG